MQVVTVSLEPLSLTTPPRVLERTFRLMSFTGKRLLMFPSVTASFLLSSNRGMGKLLRVILPAVQSRCLSLIVVLMRRIVIISPPSIVLKKLQVVKLIMSVKRPFG